MGGEITKFHNDYARMVSEAKYKSIHGEELKILTPKQMLQILPITFAQVKAGNASENLQNEIRQFILCIEQKKPLRKYTTI